MAQGISAKELDCLLAKKVAMVLLDVRTRQEREFVKIKGSDWIPLQELDLKFAELPKDKEIIIYCHTQNRSRMASIFLESKGYKARFLLGGIDSWAAEIDKDMQRY